MLFKRKAAQKSEPETVDNKEKSYVIPYSKPFRGFKKFPLVISGNRGDEENNEKVYGKDFSNSVCKFTCFNYEPQSRMAVLYIDDLRMGAVFDPDQVNAIESGLIEKIHFEYNENVFVYLDDSGNKQTLHRLRVLVKYKDEN